MYTLNSTASRTSDFLTTFSTLNQHLQRRRIQCQCAVRQGPLLRRRHHERSETLGCDGSISTTTSPRDNPNGLRFCDNVPPFRTMFKGSAAYTIPWDIQVSGSFTARPGTSVSATYTVTAIAGRPIVGGLPHVATINVTGRAEHPVPRLPKATRRTRRQDLPHRPPPDSRLRRYLQRAERRNDHPRQSDLRRHGDDSDGESHRPDLPGSGRVGVLKNRVIGELSNRVIG